VGFKNILKRVSYFIKDDSKKFSKTVLCGVPLKVLDGTVRKKVDQDDAWWFYLTKHHDVVFDIGCNVGYTAIIALIQNPNRQIVLVDPNPKALEKAATNLIGNGLANKVNFMASFVSNSTDETVKFYTVGSGAAGSMYASHAETASSMNSFLEVNTVTLDYIASYYNLKPDLVKIDVEGAETLVMQGASKLANESKCTFFVEMHNVKDLGMEAAGQLMMDWCLENGYRAWYLKTGELLDHAAKIKDRGKCHLLLLPQEKQYPEYLKGIKQNAPLPNSI